MEKQINLTTQNTYLISILISQNGYSFFVLNTTNNEIESCKDEGFQPANAKLILDRIDAELKQNWSKEFPNAAIKICYHHSYFAVVPSEIFDDECKSNYLKFNTKLYTNDSISCDTNLSLNLNIPFVPYVNIHNELLNTYETVDFTHSINVGIRWAEKLCKHQEGEHAFAFLQEEAFILIIMKGDKLQFANYFEYKTAEDFAYYCLFTLEQYHCYREEMHFSILCKVSTESEMYHYMYAYVKNVVLISYEELNFKGKLTIDQGHFFNSNPFLALQLCE